MPGVELIFHLLQFLQIKPGIFGCPQFLQEVSLVNLGALMAARRLP
jgi:hypothetical protein